MAGDDDNSRRARIRRMYSGGRWFTVSRDFLLVFTIEETFMLSYLVNMADQHAKNHPGDEWFPLSVKKVAYNLRITRRVQDRILLSLEEKDVIKRRQKGLPAKRQMWIDYDLIDSLIIKAMYKNDESLEAPNRGP